MDFDWTVKVTDLAIVGATLLSPFLAVQATEFLRRRTAEADDRRKVFYALMSTRGARLAPDHVMALNRIDLAFPAKRYSEVADSWAIYLRHLNTPHDNTPQGNESWGKETVRLFHAMLKQMANAIGTPFSDSILQYNAYYPTGYADAENRQRDLQVATLEVMKGNVALVVKPVPNSNPTPTGQKP
jgi:hypothetical protein